MLVYSSGGRETLTNNTLDTVAMGFFVLVVVGVVLRLGHLQQ